MRVARAPVTRPPAFGARAYASRARSKTASKATPRPDYDATTLFSPSVREIFLPEHIGEMYNLPKRPSPFARGGALWQFGLGQRFIDNGDSVSLNPLRTTGSSGEAASEEDVAFSDERAVRAGAREVIYYDPKKVRAAIVTCGGLCPGLNDVVRSITLTLEDYGVEDIVGIKYGFRGFFADPENALEAPMKLTSAIVDDIQITGGSMLGSSRGGADMPAIVQKIEEMELDFLFVIGGNGSHAGALAIDKLCREKNLTTSVIGVPKTIDNDILLLDRTFGFQTAVDEAVKAIRSANIEARSADNGVGLVRLMGRQSGFIAMHAALASGNTDVCLIPEIDCPLEGSGGVLAHIVRVIERQNHAVIVVAEGAGQEQLGMIGETDASGNPVLQNFAKYLQQKLKEAKPNVDIKYIDPTYMVRACRTNASDAVYCSILGQNAVHAAFAGLSAVTVGMCSGHYVYLPIPPVISAPRTVDPEGRMFERLRFAIGQPTFSKS
ncbi:putative phosphofructokinase [Ostreococcus tauri]|uniref:Putative phosphofructokinase n=1 Tax=Ostreococcus tauri TaxID=70448 RepID=A0A1Y5II33_OSTTA|nr:putative phosphofructokinase [Ostreococcus tauri]